MTERIDELLELLSGIAEDKRYNKLRFYQPYDPQALFHSRGLTFTERLLRAGNQEGKTFAGAAEMAMHLTGLYPPWWAGRRWERPVTAWVAGEGALLTRDGPQNLLFGTPGVESLFGTGFVPRDLIIDRSLGRGVTDGLDTVQVRHVTGGISTVTFKSYDQGRAKFQSASVDIIWLDEEPPEDIYNECLARFTATKGMIYITFTPLKGMSTVVSLFLNETSPYRSDTVMTIYDAKHILPEEREAILAKYPPHQRDARAMGVPMMGSGRIFPYSDEMIAEEPMELANVPQFWSKLWSVDFGIAHPFAAVLSAWDRDTDVFHVLASVRMSDALPLSHVGAMRPIAANVPVAWPQDGTERRDDGKPLSDQYKRHGLNMLDKHATWPDGSVSTENGILEMQARMTTNRFKVNRLLLNTDWGNEYRMYHRDEKGLIVKLNDDLMSATRVGVMMMRMGKNVHLMGDTSIGTRLKNPGFGGGVAAGTDFNVWR